MRKTVGGDWRFNILALNTSSAQDVEKSFSTNCPSRDSLSPRRSNFIQLCRFRLKPFCISELAKYNLHIFVFLFPSIEEMNPHFSCCCCSYNKKTIINVSFSYIRVLVVSPWSKCSGSHLLSEWVWSRCSVILLSVRAQKWKKKEQKRKENEHVYFFVFVFWSISFSAGFKGSLGRDGGVRLKSLAGFKSSNLIESTNQTKRWFLVIPENCNVLGQSPRDFSKQKLRENQWK